MTAHAFCTFFGQMMPRMDVTASRSALEKWISQPRPALVENVPGYLGTVSCVYDVGLLEHAFRIMPEPGKAQIIKVIVSVAALSLNN